MTLEQAVVLFFSGLMTGGLITGVLLMAFDPFEGEDDFEDDDIDIETEVYDDVDFDCDWDDDDWSDVDNGSYVPDEL